MAGKSMLQRLFDTMQRSIDDDVSCVLNPRHCRELLDRERSHTQYSDQLVKRLQELNAEIARLKQELDNKDTEIALLKKRQEESWEGRGE